MSTEITKVEDGFSNQVIELINNSAEEGVRNLLANVDTGELLNSFLNVTCNIAKSKYEMVTKIYTSAILAEVQREARTLDSIDQAVADYNSHIRALLSNLDTSNTENVNNVKALIEQVRLGLSETLAPYNRPSIFSRIGSLFRR